jgi:uncharacterized protein
VHQDGLVHISMLSSKFVKDPREVVKAGDVVKVKVLEVDLPRKRIALTMRLDEATPRTRAADQPGGENRSDERRPGPANRAQRDSAPSGNRPSGSGLMAEAFARAMKK